MRTIKALFLDFYGTVVHEDDDIIPVICNEIKESSKIECDWKDISRYWWNVFSKMFSESYGDNFITQRELGLISLRETIVHFHSNVNGDMIIEKQFSHWQKPNIFSDSKPFIEAMDLPIYILSNIDSNDIHSAIEYHNLRVDDVITSEDVRSYKPRSEMFQEALKRYGLTVDEVLHIGDSLTSDIRGAQNVGIKAIWINRKGKPMPDDISPDHTIANFEELEELL